MKPRKNYLSCTLANVPYLLPYGQSIVDYASGMRINDSGERLWEAIRQGADREELLALLQEDCGASDEERPALAQDQDDFLATLTRQGALLSEVPDSPYPERSAQIGPLLLSLQVPDALWETCFLDFAHSAHNPTAFHQRVVVRPQPPASRENGSILVRSRELIIAETENSYLFLPLADSALKEMHVTKDGSLAELYCPGFADADSEELFHAIRFAFLVAAAQNGLYVLHSASILYRDRAWLFSGSSGTGKSTHTGLWHDHFGTPVLNGDLNMIGMEDGVPRCYGLPWNGTSGIRTVGSWPLGGITFLKKAPTDEIRIPDADQKILYLSQRLISPSWTKDQLEHSLAFCGQLTERAPIFRLHCTKEPRAAELMRKTIDCALAPEH